MELFLSRERRLLQGPKREAVVEVRKTPLAYSWVAVKGFKFKLRYWGNHFSYYIYTHSGNLI